MGEVFTRQERKVFIAIIVTILVLLVVMLITLGIVLTLVAIHFNSHSELLEEQDDKISNITRMLEDLLADGTKTDRNAFEVLKEQGELLITVQASVQTNTDLLQELIKDVAFLLQVNKTFSGITKNILEILDETRDTNQFIKHSIQMLNYTLQIFELKNITELLRSLEINTAETKGLHSSVETIESVTQLNNGIVGATMDIVQATSADVHALNATTTAVLVTTNHIQNTTQSLQETHDENNPTIVALAATSTALVILVFVVEMIFVLSILFYTYYRYHKEKM